MAAWNDRFVAALEAAVAAVGGSVARDGRQWNDYVVALLEEIAARIGSGGPSDALVPADIGVSVHPYDAGLVDLALVDSAANRLPYTDGAESWTYTSLTAWARTLLDDATVTAARATLGVPEPIVLANDWVTSSATTAVVTGLSFTPAASATYLIQVVGMFSAAISSTGLVWAVASSGADGVGAFYGTVRGTAAPGVAAIYSAFDGGGVVSGSSSGGAALSPFVGFAIVTTDASPTDIGVYAATEIAASAVTIKAGSVMLVTRLT